jgi:hypothetical protein
MASHVLLHRDMPSHLDSGSPIVIIKDGMLIEQAKSMPAIRSVMVPRKWSTIKILTGKERQRLVERYVSEAQM